MTFEDLETRVTAEYAAQSLIPNERIASIDPMTIALIIEVVIKIGVACYNHFHNLPTLAKRPIFARVHIRRALRDVEHNRADTREIIETIYSLGYNATEEDFASLPDLRM